MKKTSYFSERKNLLNSISKTGEVMQKLLILAAATQLLLGCATWPDTGVSQNPCRSSSHYASSDYCQPLEIEGNVITFDVGGRCYEVAFSVQRWADGINRYDGSWRDTLSGTIYSARNQCVCPNHSTLHFDTSRAKRGELYAVKILVWREWGRRSTYTLKYIHR